MKAKCFLLMALVVAIVGMSGQAEATLITRDSELFSGSLKYEGDVSPPLGFGSVANWTTDGSVATVVNGTATGSAAGWSSGISGITGATLEVRFKVTTLPSVDVGLMGLSLAYNDNGRILDVLNIIKGTTSGLRIQSNAVTLADNLVLTDDFHTLRFATEGGLNQTAQLVWLDGVQLGASNGLTTGAGTGTRAWVGDFASTVDDGTYLVDYIRVDTSGAYAPPALVPEPSSVVLLVISVIGFMAYAWRRRK